MFCIGDGIVRRLSQYPDTSAAKMHDWLKENYPKFPELSSKTVYNYVMKLLLTVTASAAFSVRSSAAF